jgi:hypothetical protein
VSTIPNTLISNALDHLDSAMIEAGDGRMRPSVSAIPDAFDQLD